MPVEATYWYGPHESDPRRWSRCLAKSAAAMVAQGWNKHARKFMEVNHRRAHRLWLTNAA